MSRKKILISVIIFTILIIILIIALNPSYRADSLYVSENKWNAIQKERTENKNLILKDIKFNDYKLIIDEKNNTLYYSIPKEKDNVNNYKSNVSFRTNGSRDTKLAILSNSIMIYNEREYHIYNLKYTNLPILNITYNRDEEINQKNIPMEMYLFDNLSNIPNKITISMGKIKADEGSYIISLHMLTPGKNKRDNKISILNMKPNSEYVLTKAMQATENSATVELFLNNEYKGIFSFGTVTF